MYQIVLCTCPSKEIAQNIAVSIVEEQLAACVNIIANIQSVYRWNGEVNIDNEVQLVIKTSSALFKKLSTKIELLHPYEVPEIISLDLTQGNQAYLDWLKDSLVNYD